MQKCNLLCTVGRLHVCEPIALLLPHGGRPHREILKQSYLRSSQSWRISLRKSFLRCAAPELMQSAQLVHKSHSCRHVCTVSRQRKPRESNSSLRHHAAATERCRPWRHIVQRTNFCMGPLHSSSRSRCFSCLKISLKARESMKLRKMWMFSPQCLVSALFL